MNQDNQSDMPISDLPTALSNPSLNAMALVGITRLEQLSQITEKELLALHGVGPKTIRILAPVMAERGISFAPPTKTKTEGK